MKAYAIVIILKKSVDGRELGRMGREILEAMDLYHQTRNQQIKFYQKSIITKLKKTYFQKHGISALDSFL